jgi:glycosyltransferase involved in cell wall biosynthesis
MIRILYDGWSLSHSPNSPGALHLLTLLEARPEGVEPLLALPAAPPAWVPEGVTGHVTGVKNTPSGRLLWEQVKLPGLASQVGADLIHITSHTPALFAPIRTVISPAGFTGFPNEGLKPKIKGENRDMWESGQPEGFAERLRRSLSRGSQERVLALFWPQDLPYYEGKTHTAVIKWLPPIVHPAFLRDQEQGKQGTFHDLPDTYFLYQGPYNRFALHNLLQAWSWATGPLGDSCTLLLVGVAEDRLKPLDQFLKTSGLADSLQVLPTLSPDELAGLYRACKGLFHPAPLSVWEGPLRYALSCARPIITAQSPLVDALLGPAAYSLPEKDFRGMGAAMITIAIEEEVEESLSRSARERSAKWDLGLFKQKLALNYKALRT